MSHYDSANSSGYLIIEHYLNGNYKSLKPTVDTEWQLGDNQIKAAGGQIVHFYEDGSFKSMTLAEDASILVHGVKALVAQGSEIHFYPSGAVRRITVARQSDSYFWSDHWSYHGLSVAPFTTLEFRTDGTVRAMIRSGVFNSK